MTTAGGMGTAVFVFDASGQRLAATAEADGLIGGDGVTSLAALEARLRGDDGLPVRLADVVDREAAIAVGRDSRHYELSAESALASEGDRRTQPLTIVRLELLDDTPEATVHRALGGVLAHQLRTPLTTIYGGAQLLVGQGVTEGTRNEAAATVAREAQRLHDVIEDLVVLARFERFRSADLEPVLLQRVLPGLAETEREGHPAATVELAIPPGLPPVRANVRNVQHAFRNLLSSAFTYGGHDGRVSVAGSVEPDGVTVRILDEGPGLGPEEADRAFDLYGRTARTTTDPSGVNLAAFVSRRLIEAMGGRVWAVSHPDAGETAFSLPRMDTPVDERATAM